MAKADFRIGVFVDIRLALFQCRPPVVLALDVI
jgi:hypothetical protein